MGKKQPTKYSDMGLELLKQEASSLMEYIQSRPYNKMKDRVNNKTGATIAKIEDQRKDRTAALKEYGELIEMIARLETIEEAKQEDVRGDQDITPFESGE